LLSDHALSRALARAGLRAPVRFEEVTPSTQTLALAMAADGAPEWTLVAAGHQTAGRGRLDRRWDDVAGSSLLVSIVLRPSLAPADAGLLTLLAGAALAETVEALGDQRASCKWPNDVLIGGRKAAGILAGSALAPDGDAFEHVVLGIGANLGVPPPEQPDAAAINATDALVLETFLRVFCGRYEPAHPAFAASVLATYRDRCATLGERVRATTTDGAVVEGLAVDLEPDGGLVVEDERGQRSVVRFGDVGHLMTEPSGRGRALE
jgi:BirA family transcriptional regulator, biotin operon repressor / biotin---[acetyl-CoA-carboxylase] ligase